MITILTSCEEKKKQIEKLIKLPNMIYNTFMVILFFFFFDFYKFLLEQ